jgi:hypothetical protein
VGSPVLAQEVDEAVSAGLAPPAGGQCSGPPPPAIVGLAPSCWSARSSEGDGEGGGQREVGEAEGRWQRGDGISPRRRAAGGRSDADRGGRRLLLLIRWLGFERRQAAAAGAMQIEAGAS